MKKCAFCKGVHPEKPKKKDKKGKDKKGKDKKGKDKKGKKDKDKKSKNKKGKKDKDKKSKSKKEVSFKKKKDHASTAKAVAHQIGGSSKSKKALQDFVKALSKKMTPPEEAGDEIISTGTGEAFSLDSLERVTSHGEEDYTFPVDPPGTCTVLHGRDSKGNEMIYLNRSTSLRLTVNGTTIDHEVEVFTDKRALILQAKLLAKDMGDSDAFEAMEISNISMGFMHTQDGPVKVSDIPPDLLRTAIDSVLERIKAGRMKKKAKRKKKGEDDTPSQN